MNHFEQLEAKIAEQQKGREGTNAFYVGLQLLDICRGSEELAEIVLTDLNNKDMGIDKAEAKIAAYASAHKKGNQGCCPPQEADRILREFYGLPAAGAEPSKKSDSGVIDILDFLGV